MERALRISSALSEKKTEPREASHYFLGVRYDYYLLLTDDDASPERQSHLIKVTQQVVST